MAGAEQGGHRRALRPAEHIRPSTALRVHDSADVVHSFLERRRLVDRVRKARAALVKHDYARECRQPPHEALIRRTFPGELEVRHEAGRKYEVPGSFTQNLIGDPNGAAHRVPGIRLHDERVQAGWASDRPTMKCSEPPPGSGHTAVPRGSRRLDRCQRDGSLGRPASASGLRHDRRRTTACVKHAAVAFGASARALR